MNINQYLNLEDAEYDNLANAYIDAVVKGKLDLALGTLNLMYAPGKNLDQKIVNTYREVRDWATDNNEWELWDRCETQINYWTDNAQQDAINDHARTELAAMSL